MDCTRHHFGKYTVGDQIEFHLDLLMTLTVTVKLLTLLVMKLDKQKITTTTKTTLITKPTI